MRKKSETTIIERALEYVSGFDRVFQTPEASAEGGFTGSMQKFPSLHNYTH